MNNCIDRPDTRLRPTHASEAHFAPCNAGAIHTSDPSYIRSLMPEFTSHQFTG